MKRVLLLFFIGFIMGPIGDYCHVISGTTGYPQDIFRWYLFGIPFWVPFLFGGAALAVGWSHPYLDRFLGEGVDRPGAATLGIASFGILIFLGLYILSGFLPWPAGGYSDLILGGLTILVWVFLERSWQGILLGILTAVAGSAAEIFLVAIGWFFYLPKESNMWGVPSWLPWLYFAASVTLGNFGRVIKKSPRLEAGSMAPPNNTDLKPKAME